MKDKEFLTHLLLFWPHQSHPANKKHLDKLRAMIDATPEHQDTPVGGEASVEDKIAVFRMKYSGGENSSGMALLDLIEAVNKRMDKIEKRPAEAEF